MSIIPAESFNFFEAGIQAGPNFFVLGPLSPGCVLRRARVTVQSDPNGAVRVLWAYALGVSDTPDAASFQAGYIPFAGNGEGVLMAERLPFVAILAASQTQHFTHEFGRRVTGGAQWIILALGADSSDRGWIQIAFEVVGVQAAVTNIGGAIAVVG